MLLWRQVGKERRKRVKPRAGFEPIISRLADWHSNHYATTIQTAGVLIEGSDFSKCQEIVPEIILSRYKSNLNKGQVTKSSRIFILDRSCLKEDWWSSLKPSQESDGWEKTLRRLLLRRHSVECTNGHYKSDIKLHCSSAKAEWKIFVYKCFPTLSTSLVARLGFFPST